MELTRENIYRLIAGALGTDIKTFNPQLNLVTTYNLDSFSIVEIALIIEEHMGVTAQIGVEYLTKINTAADYADIVLRNQIEAN